jgi:hypothetical protein
MIEDGVETIPRPEPLGYIGEEYYRFYIHFISAQKDRKNPYQYIITGKTRIKDNIFTFRGIFKITDARIYKEGDVPGIRQGYVKGEYIFYEDRRQKGSGKLEGTFKSNFIIDRNNKLRYDALMLVADGFSNNQFVGTRKVYGSKEFQKCNWGDYRIPDSGNFDSGAGEFCPDEKYIKNGWESYKGTLTGNPGNPETKKALEIEAQDSQWWK